MDLTQLTDFFGKDQTQLFAHLLDSKNHKFVSGIPNILGMSYIESFQQSLKKQASFATEIHERLNRDGIACIQTIEKDIEAYRGSYTMLIASYAFVLTSGIYVTGYAHGLPPLPEDLSLTSDMRLFLDANIDWELIEGAIAELAELPSSRGQTSEIQHNPSSAAWGEDKKEAVLFEPILVSPHPAASFSLASPGASGPEKAPSAFYEPATTGQDKDANPKKASEPRRRLEKGLSKEEQTAIRMVWNKEASKKTRDKKTAEHQALQTNFEKLYSENKELQFTHTHLQTKLNPLRRKLGLSEQPLTCKSLAYDPMAASTNIDAMLTSSTAFFKPKTSTSRKVASGNAEAAPAAAASDVEEVKGAKRRALNRVHAHNSRNRKKLKRAQLESSIPNLTTKNHQLRALIQELQTELDATQKQIDDLEACASLHGATLT